MSRREPVESLATVTCKTQGDEVEIGQTGCSCATDYFLGYGVRFDCFKVAAAQLHRQASQSVRRDSCEAARALHTSHSLPPHSLCIQPATMHPCVQVHATSMGRGSSSMPYDDILSLPGSPSDMVTLGIIPTPHLTPGMVTLGITPTPHPTPGALVYIEVQPTPEPSPLRRDDGDSPPLSPPIDTAHDSGSGPTSPNPRTSCSPPIETATHGGDPHASSSPQEAPYPSFTPASSLTDDSRVLSPMEIQGSGEAVQGREVAAAAFSALARPPSRLSSWCAMLSCFYIIFII